MSFLAHPLEFPAASSTCFANPKPSAKFLKGLRVSVGDERVGSRARVRFSIRDSVSGQNLRKYGGQFSFPVKPSKEEEEKQDYYLNMGYAIRTIREEFPELFHRELRFDIYREDIVFKDPVNTFAGIDNYKSIFWALRFHGRLFFKALWLDIVSVWQPVENVIMVRWTVLGIPRGPWETRGRFDGTSVYKLDKTGKIYEHRVDNIIPTSPPKFHVLDVEELIRSVACPSTPKPTYFETSSSSPSSSSSSSGRTQCMVVNPRAVFSSFDT